MGTKCSLTKNDKIALMFQNPLKAIKENYQLLLVVCLAVALSSIGLFWGLTTHQHFQPDEFQQHLAIAKNLINVFDKEMVPDVLVSKQFNARGFGTQVGIFSYLIIKIFDLSPTENIFYVLGRLVSIFYGVGSVVLTYFLSMKLFKNKNIGLLAALLIAIFDLRNTQSHYATPDIAHAFFVYLSCYALYLLSKRRCDLLLFLFVSLTVALSFSMRFDPVPLFVLAVLIAKRLTRTNLVILGLILTLIVGWFYVSTGFNFTLRDAMASLQVLSAEVANVAYANARWLYNPVLYLFAIMGGTSFLVLISFLISLPKLIRTKTLSNGQKSLLGIIILAAGLEFLLAWSGGATFIRRATIFLPFVAIVTAWGLVKVPKIAIVVVVYTLGLTIASQLNFLFDSRYAAQDFIKAQQTPNHRYYYDYYAMLENVPKGESTYSTADTLVLHESYYGRYYKYFTTPFKVPKCCSEVYHCQDKDCAFFQQLLLGKSRDYKLVKGFYVNQVFPEKILFNNLFGNYETFLGDTLIYERL